MQKEKRFEIVYQEGGLTPLLDAEGKPVVTKETAD